MKKSTKKALSILLATVMIISLIMPAGVSAFASGAVIDVTSEQELVQALDRNSEVSNINVVQSFTINSDCKIMFDPAHLNNYHNTVMTIENDITLTIANGGSIGCFWPSFEGDWTDEIVPNGSIVNYGTIIVERGGATVADFEANRGIIIVKDGGEAVCCGTNYGTVTVENGGRYCTTQGSSSANLGVININEGAQMESCFGTIISNGATGTVNLNGCFNCGCIGDDFWFDNQGTVTGGGDIILYEAAPDFMPVNDMDALIVKMMGLLGQTKRFDNWDDINIFRTLEVSDFASLKAALPENRTVAGERVEGNMDTLIELKASVEIPAGEEIRAMARITVPEGITLTVNDGATLECGVENRGVVNVLSGGNLFTTQGGNINNHGRLSVSEGAVIKSQMGGEVLNFPEAKMILDGVCRVGCIGFGGHDAYWFNNFGYLVGNGVIVLYEAAPDEVPVSDLNALASEITSNIGVGDGVPTVRIEPTHVHTYTDVVTAPTCTEQGYTTHTCECGDVKVDTYVPALGHDFSDNAEVCRNGCGTANPDYVAPHVHAYTKTVVAPKATAVGYTLNKCACGVSYKSNYKAPTGKPAGFKCASRSATSEKFTWTKTKGVSGYQIQLLNSAGKSAGNKVLTGNAYTFAKLAAGHAYKARVRFYIKAADGKNYYGAWATINSPTLPAGTSITKVTGAKKAFTAQWKKGAVTGYQLQFGTNAKFAKATTKTIKGAAKVKLAVKSLKGGARYYVRIRTFKTIAGKNYYSTWSGAKSVATKK